MKVQKRCSRKYIAGKHNEARTGIKQSSAGTFRPQRTRLAQTVDREEGWHRPTEQSTSVPRNVCMLGSTHFGLSCILSTSLSVSLVVWFCLLGRTKFTKFLTMFYTSRSHSFDTSGCLSCQILPEWIKF